MADVSIPGVAAATQDSGDTVLGVKGGAVRRFAASPSFAQLAADDGAGRVGFKQAGTGAVTRTAQAKLRELTVSVKDFGAVGNGVADDMAAIQSAIDSLTGGSGGTLRFPAGYYRVTGTVRVGLSVLTDYAFIVDRTDALTDPEIAAKTSAANVTANRALSHVNIVFDAGAFLVADFSPSTPTPVLAYNLAGSYSAGHGEIVGASVISTSMMVDGAYYVDAVSAPQTNNLIGVFIQTGCKRLEKTFVSGLEHGVVALNPFWVRIADVYAYWIGGACLNIAQANALTADNLVFWQSNRGLVFDGDASAVRGIHTEQVAEDIVVFKSDCCEFGPGYLEDVSTDDGAGKFAVRLGSVGNGQKVLHSRFVGLRCGAARPNKSAIRVWDTRNSTFANCRVYSKTVTADANSTGLIENCDFAIATVKWTSLGDFLRAGLIAYPGSAANIKAIYHRNGVSVGGPVSVPAGAFHSVDLAVSGAAFDGSQTVLATPTSGIDSSLLWVARIAGANTVRIRFYNPTTDAISLTGNMAVTIVNGS